MGLSLSDAERLGLAELHPDHPSRRGASPAAARARPLPRVDALGMNKTEAAFAARLDAMKLAGLVLDYRFEPLKLRLAGRTWYRIDFVVRRPDRSLAAVEVKGFMRDDAAVKLKLAPELFPFFDYYLARRDRSCPGGWDVRPVTRAGIGVHPVGDSWMESRA